MKKALVIGVTGGFGEHVAAALLDKGWHVKALVRDPAKRAGLARGIKVVHGDARRIEDVRRAADGVDVLVYGANVPYPRWKAEALPLLEVSATVAQERGLTLVFPGNVYGYDPNDGPDFDEAAPVHPVTRKGAIRKRMEQRLQQASRHGAQVLLLRAGDFIGGRSGSSWMRVLSKTTDHGYRLLRPGPGHVAHTWANLPDVARTVALLLDRRDRLPAYAPFHFEGYRMSFNEMVDTIREASGRRVTVRTFPWWAVTLFAPFVPFLRELREMRYLWRQEVNLDGARLREALKGDVPHTPFPEALAAAGIIELRN